MSCLTGDPLTWFANLAANRCFSRSVRSISFFPSNRPTVKFFQTLCQYAVSYTHLDVYKRQIQHSSWINYIYGSQKWQCVSYFIIRTKIACSQTVLKANWIGIMAPSLAQTKLQPTWSCVFIISRYGYTRLVVNIDW